MNDRAREVFRRAGVYPVARPSSSEGSDPRFTVGLLLDVVEVLERAGYPKPQASDLTELSSALFRFIYGSAEEGSR